jgi:hypothetical protein
VTDLDELQRLLLGEQKKESLDDLNGWVHDPVQRVDFIADVLPQALRAAQGQGERLAGALQEPVTHCIHQSVQRDAGRFADALYPAMGPAIRKSIAETLKEFVQSINQVLEHSFSYQGLKWRWEAMRSGVPFAEVVLKNTLLYRVEESYLIHRESGLLMAHATARQDAAAQDEDAVSAMLTAIQDFVRDAFAGGGSNDLETLEMGERIVWVMRGPKAMMACVIRGLPPVALRERLTSLLDEMQQKFNQPMTQYQGDRDSLAGIGELLQLSLASESRKGDRNGGFPWAAVLLILGLLGGGAYAWYYFSDDSALRQRREALLRSIDAEPGLVVLDASLRDGRYRVRGLRDPMARDPRRVVGEAGWSEAELELAFLSYQSLDPGLLLAQARAMLDPPDGVDLDLRGAVLIVKGQALPEWVDRVKRHFVPPPGIGSVDASALTDDADAMLRQLASSLQPPAEVELALDGRDLRLSGNAPLGWLSGLEAALRKVDWLRGCTAGGLGIVEWRQAKAQQQALAQAELFFSDGVILDEESEKRLTRLTGELKALQDLTLRLGVRLGISLLGHSDGVGNRDRNFWLRHQRVGWVTDRLEAGGLTEARLRSDIESRFEPALQPDLARRKVVMRVELQGTPELPLSSCR